MYDVKVYFKHSVDTVVKTNNSIFRKYVNIFSSCNVHNTRNEQRKKSLSTFLNGFNFYGAVFKIYPVH